MKRNFSFTNNVVRNCNSLLFEIKLRRFTRRMKQFESPYQAQRPSQHFKRIVCLLISSGIAARQSELH